ncbi:MAG: YCF48-related protein [Ignavibacteria bacterium]
MSIILILYFLLNNVYSQLYWIDYPSPTQKKLTKSLFVDSLYGWVIGDSGIVIKTSNGGTNWNIEPCGVSGSELRDITFISRNTGWIISVDSTYKTFILQTTNSGLNWVKTYFPDTTTILNTIFFIDNSTGYVSGFSGRIYKTSNNGLNWNECYIDTTGCLYLFPKNDIYFIDSQTGFACGGVIELQGIFVKTTNGGNSWFSMCISPEPLNEILYLGSGKIALMGGDYDLGSIYGISTNSGSNWQYGQTGCFGNATAFAFRTPAEVWAALSFSGKFAVNLDSMKPGSRWECISTPDNIAINSIEFLSEYIGYAFGNSGKIFKYNENVIGLQSNNNNNIPRYNALYQNYPNPFNPFTLIEYYISEPADVYIKIYDVTGKEIRSYSEGYRSKGNYSLSFNAEELPSAVYYYSLATNTETISRKMVLIK